MTYKKKDMSVMNSSDDARLTSAVRWAFITAFGLLAIAIALPNLMRAREGSPPSCINNLRLIESAKEQWALEYNKTNSEIPRWEDILPYIGRGGGVMPKCPKGGAYNLQRVGVHPTCTYPGHLLP